MPDYVRVRDRDSGHELSVQPSQVSDAYEVLDEPAARHGKPLPPKHAVRRPKAAEPERPESLPSENKSGQKAATLKEK